MKSFYPIFVIGLAMVLTATTLIDKAPTSRIGVVSTNYIINQLPEVKAAGAELDTLKSQLEAQLQTKVSEYNQKLDAFETNKATYSRLILKDKQEDLQRIKESIGTFQRAAEEEVANREQELFQPLWEMMENAIAAVAKEKGYTHVINTDLGSSLMIYSEASTKIDEAVLAKIRQKNN